MTVAEITLIADTWGMHGDVGTGWMVVMMVAMVLFWGAIIFGAVWLIRGSFYGRPERRDSPAEVLERRFAEGAISVEDYRERREVLLSGARRHRGQDGAGDGGRQVTSERAREGRPAGPGGSSTSER